MGQSSSLSSYPSFPPTAQLYNRVTKRRQFASSVVSDIGGRAYQEDRSVVIDNLRAHFPNVVTVTSALYVVLDGHGGHTCAEFVESNFSTVLCNTEAFRQSNYSEAFLQTFKQLETTWTDQAMLKSTSGWGSGTCVLAALVLEEGVWVAWVGDCRMVGYNGNHSKQIQQITTDHKPSAIREQNRILKMGGEVRAIEQEMCCCMPLRDLGPKRVFPGGLAVSRSIGTIKCKLKQLNAIPGAVLSTPDITFIQPENGIQWFIMASDGLWDYYPNSIQLASLIVKKITSGSGPTSAEEMSSHILNILRSNKSLRRPPDNATILVIKIISDTPCVSISRYHHQQPATIEMKRAL